MNPQFMSIVRHILLFLWICHTSAAAIIADQQLVWVESVNTSQWYTPLDMCMLSNSSRVSVEDITSFCENKLAVQAREKGKVVEPLKPIRCRVGNSWPSKGAFCSAIDIPYSSRENLRRAIRGYDDPSVHPLKELFRQLSREKGALLLVGDSVMQQYYSAIACELEREGVWTDPNNFKNTDVLKYVEAEVGSPPVPIKFLPIYHFVNGRFDRVANASMHNLKKTVEGFLQSYESLMVYMNVGLHFVSKPVPHFSRPDYRNQITEALTYLHKKTLEFPSKKVRIVWRETSAQHFPTRNGYWPGVRYAVGMSLSCVPINDTTPEGDWRNKEVREIVQRHSLNVRIVPFYHQTVPLWSEHVNGHLRDCTHLCWSPMLYQPSFHFMLDAMK